MREIKFRFYSKNIDTGKISVHEHSLEDIEDEDSWQGASPWRRIAICQYTGLNDKNGIEIYEGDIVTPDGTEVGIIEWWQSQAQFHVDYSRSKQLGKHYYGLNFSGELEVIGNIYEDPDLAYESLTSKKAST